MDNNKKVQMNNLEYKNKNTVSPTNPMQNIKSQVSTYEYENFKDIIKKKRNAIKNKKIVSDNDNNVKEDLIVEDSLRKLINNDNDINVRIKEEVAGSAIIKKLLSDEEISPKDKIPSK